MISAAELASLRSTVESTFVHTYTLTPRIGGADDAWGDQSVTSGTALPGRPCKYKEKSAPVVTESGLANVNVPTLWVPASDNISLGDQVSQVKDAYGAVLVPGPVEVEDVSPSGLVAGGTLHLEVALRQVQNV